MSSIDRPPKARLPGNSRSRKGASRRLLAPLPSRGSPRPDCRPGASRPGTIPICAPRWPMRRRSCPRPTRADIEAARSVLARRERFAAGAQIVLLGGRFYRRAFGSPPDGGLRSRRDRRRAQCGRRSFSGSQRGAEPVRVYHRGRARGKARRADHGPASRRRSHRPTRSIRGRPLRSTSGRRRRSSRYSTALMRVSSDMQRRS